MNLEMTTSVRDTSNCRLNSHVWRAVLFGGFMRYWGGYADQHAMEKSILGTYSIIIPEKGRIRLLEEDFE
jgi:hypothetical protein